MLQSVPSFMMNMHEYAGTRCRKNTLIKWLLVVDRAGFETRSRMPGVTVKGRLTEDTNQEVEVKPSTCVQVIPSIYNILDVSLAATRKSTGYCTQLQAPTLQHGKMQSGTRVLQIPVAVGVSAETVVARLLRSSLWMQALPAQESRKPSPACLRNSDTYDEHKHLDSKFQT